MAGEQEQQCDETAPLRPLGDGSKDKSEEQPRPAGHAKVVCRCNAVEITFPSSSPKFTAECCLRTCYAELVRLERLGGPALPPDIKNKEKPIGQVAFVNRMRVERGIDKLQFFSVGGTRHRLWMVCSRCLTHLLWQHAFCQDNAVLVYTALGTLVDADVSPKVLRWFEQGWPGNVSKLDTTLPSVWMDCCADNLTGCGPWQRTMADALNTCRQPIEDGLYGEEWCGLLDVLRTSGKEVEELDDDEAYTFLSWADEDRNKIDRVSASTLAPYDYGRSNAFPSSMATTREFPIFTASDIIQSQSKSTKEEEEA